MKWKSQTGNFKKQIAKYTIFLYCNDFFLLNFRLDWERGFTPQHWAQTLSLVTLMCLAAAGAWVTVQLFEDPIVRVLSAGFALIIIYVCVR